VGEIEKLQGTAKPELRGARWHKVIFTLDYLSDFLALKGLTFANLKEKQK